MRRHGTKRKYNTKTINQKIGLKNLYVYFIEQNTIYILINLAQLTILSLHIESQFDLIENIYGVLQNVSRSNFNCAEKCTLDLDYKQALRNRLLEISDRTQYEESGVLQNLSTIITQGLSSSYNIVNVTWSRNNNLCTQNTVRELILLGVKVYFNDKRGGLVF